MQKLRKNQEAESGFVTWIESKGGKHTPSKGGKTNIVTDFFNIPTTTPKQRLPPQTDRSNSNEKYQYQDDFLYPFNQSPLTQPQTHHKHLTSKSRNTENTPQTMQNHQKTSKTTSDSKYLQTLKTSTSYPHPANPYHPTYPSNPSNTSTQNL